MALLERGNKADLVLGTREMRRNGSRCFREQKHFPVINKVVKKAPYPESSGSDGRKFGGLDASKRPVLLIVCRPSGPKPILCGDKSPAMILDGLTPLRCVMAKRICAH